MESATARVPPSTGLNGLLLSEKLNIPEGPEYKNTTLYQCKGGSFPRYKRVWMGGGGLVFTIH